MSHASPVRRRLATGLLAVIASLAAMVAAAAPAQAAHDVTPARIEGANQYDTAAKIAEFDHPEGSGVALLANGTDFPDALAASALSRPTIAPILLTTTDAVPASTVEALENLGVQRVVILGGTEAVSQAVEDNLNNDYTVVRHAGDTRFETAVEVAQAIVASPNASIGTMDGRRTAIIVNGLAFPDAVSAGPLAAGQSDPFPILLTSRDSIHPTTDAALTDLDIGHVVIVGGTAVVSAEVEQTLEGRGVAVTRLGGQNRSETATLVADHAALALGFDASVVNLARGDFFADALAAGPMAGRNQSPILLAATPDVLGEVNRAWLGGKCAEVTAIRALGGPAAISVETLEAAEQAAENCHDRAESQQTFMVAPMEPVEAASGVRVTSDVIGRYDDQTFSGPVDVAIFPCANAAIIGAGDQTFVDADGDGLADGLGESDTGNAAIIDVNGEPVGPAGVVRGVGPADDGILEVGMVAEGADCVVFTVFEDTDGDLQLSVDAEGRPTEPYGVNQVSWTD